MGRLEEELERMKKDLLQKRSQPGLTQTAQESLTDTDTCPKCKGTGWVFYTGDDGLEYGKQCDCWGKMVTSRRLKFAELPEAFKDVKLENFNLSIYREIDSRNLIAVAAKTVKYYLDNFDEMKSQGMGLYLYSETKGSGKTRMAVGIANALLKGHQVKFAGSTTIIKEIKRTWNKKPSEDGETESQLLDSLAAVEILIIDDFGTETPAGWINDKFYQIINDRYVGRKVTIFTSNAALDRLNYDDRITNRIKERTYQIAFPEESVRDYIAEKNNQELINNLKR
ncbi:ATP-binding protein [Lacrimispora sp.]|uniref:ATP-binding protein n=1 Tax=Lacrimispora sp. TaxID=2719234 RepID=UPI002899D5EE|nr:ATP-binding protein [Lacrimispora sp.]